MRPNPLKGINSNKLGEEYPPGLHRRPGGPPVWTGDYFRGRRIVGFTLAVAPGPVDVVLVDGDEARTDLPDRPLPAPGDQAADIQVAGSSPVDDLAGERLREAARDLGDGLERQLSALGEQGDFIRQMLDHMAAEGHLAWLVGGAVRDLMSLGAQARQADLDFTGTMGPGELYDAARRWRRAAGASDCPAVHLPRTRLGGGPARG